MAKQILRKLNHQYLPQHLFHGPEWIVLGVNNLCNLHCKMCDVGTGSNDTIFATNLTGTSPMHMPLELFERIVRQTARYYPKAKLGYAFTEPLIYKHLDESLALTHQLDLYSTITTNGMMLKQKAGVICDNHVNELFLSLDGLESIHNEIRGHANSFQKAIDGLDTLFNAVDFPDISIFCVITEWNIGSLKSFVDFFSEYPLKQIGFMHTNFTPPSVANLHNKLYGTKYPATQSNTFDTSIDSMDLDMLWNDMMSIKNAKYKYSVSFSPELKSKEDLKVFYHNPGVLIGKSCKDIFSNIMIKSDGSAIPAHGRCYNLEVGNIYKHDLPAIWSSRNFGGLRKDIIKAGGLLPACSRCCSAFS